MKKQITFSLNKVFLIVMVSFTVFNLYELKSQTTTWNGTMWSNGLPDISKDVVIAGNYSTNINGGAFQAKSLQVNAGAVLTVSPSDVLVIENGVSIATNGNLILQNNANLLQLTSTQNSGIATVRRNTFNLIRQDYVLWSAPVSGQVLQSFSPNTLSNRFYTFNPNSNNYSQIANPSTVSFDTAKGYLIRMPNNHPETPTVWSGTFNGVLNNGDKIVEVPQDTYNAVGNPYPSPINADAFIVENNLVEALYFWRKRDNATTTSYATYTLAGGVGITKDTPNPLDLIPNGNIQVGQGFIVKATNDSIFFKNNMRIQNFDNQFFRNSQKSRYWLNLTSNEDNLLFSQMMVAYMPNATSGIDDAIDGRYFNDNLYALTSTIEDQDFSIQGKGAFTIEDNVVLRLKSEQPRSFTISLHFFEGLFEDQDIFIYDKQLNVVQNLKEGSYTFFSESGVYSNRFEVIYQNILNTNNIGATAFQLQTISKDQSIQIKSIGSQIKQVQVFDLSGKLLVEKNNLDSYEININELFPSQSLYIVKIKNGEDISVTKKVIH